MSAQPVAARRGPGFAVLAVTQFILILDAAIVTIAMPSIQRGLHFSPENLSWVVSAYTLIFGGFLLLGGRVADHVGHRAMFAWGLLIFVLGSASCGLAQNSAWLIVSRGVQGFGAAVVAPAALALVMRLYTEPQERFKALGIWGALAGLGSVSGTVLGGALTDWISWRAIFWINVPIGAVCLALTPGLLPGGRVGDRNANFDVVGAIASTLGLGLVVYGLVTAPDKGWGSTSTVATLVAGVLLLIAFVVVENRVSAPLVPPSLFRLRPLTGGNVGMGLMTMALVPGMVFLTLYMQQVHHWSPIRSAVAQLPICIAIIIGTQLAPPVVGRGGPRAAVGIGSVIAAAGMAWFGGISADGGFWAQILGPSLLAGIGMGMVFVAATIAATSMAPPHLAGVASGVLNTSQQVGATLGIAILTPVVTELIKSSAKDGHPLPEALTSGYSGALVAGACIAVLVLLLSATVIPGRPPQGAPGPDGAPAPAEAAPEAGAPST
ncbi:MFS transporter [Actinomadura gamaensis]|uniref:MFS transporter n=1 Tax=Actinomadura gamaensis TaxID=1763541 RepID=A0ABV9TYP6_9ACTN